MATELSNLKVQEIQQQLLRCQSNESSYKARLQTLNSIRGQVAQQIKALSEDYEQKVTKLLGKMQKLQAENRSLKLKVSVYNEEIKSFEQRLIEKERFISKLVSRSMAEAEDYQGRSFSISSKPRVNTVELESEARSQTENFKEHDEFKAEQVFPEKQFQNLQNQYALKEQRIPTTSPKQSFNVQAEQLQIEQQDIVVKKKKTVPPPPKVKRAKRGEVVQQPPKVSGQEAISTNEPTQADRTEITALQREARDSNQIENEPFTEGVGNPRAVQPFQQEIEDRQAEREDQNVEVETTSEAVEKHDEEVLPENKEEADEQPQKEDSETEFDLGTPTVIPDQLGTHHQSGGNDHSENAHSMESVPVKRKLPPPPAAGSKKSTKRGPLPPARKIVRYTTQQEPEGTVSNQNLQSDYCGSQQAKDTPNQKLNENIRLSEFAADNSEGSNLFAESSELTENQSNILAGITAEDYSGDQQETVQQTAECRDRADSQSQEDSMDGASLGVEAEPGNPTAPKRKKRGKRAVPSVQGGTSQFSKHKKQHFGYGRSFDEILSNQEHSSNILGEKVESPSSFFNTLGHEGSNVENEIEDDDRKFIDESSIEQIEDTSVMSNIYFGDESNETAVVQSAVQSPPPPKKMSKKKGKRDQIKTVDPNAFV